MLKAKQNHMTKIDYNMTNLLLKNISLQTLRRILVISDTKSV